MEKKTVELWCPICNSKLSVKEKHGRKLFWCAEHGEMNFYLDHDPKASVALVEACDAVGIVNIEEAP